MADAKPATDADVDHCRNLHSYVVRALVARIDKEIKDRLAAEARVKVLEDALRVIAKAELYDPTTGIIDADVLAICQQEARATLKEPANG